MRTRLFAGLLICLAFVVSPELTLAELSWTDATEVRLSIRSETEGESSEYIFELFSEGDARVTVVDRTVQREEWPVILLVSGRLMLVRNLEMEEGYEIDALDVPVLMLQLVLDLLQRSSPEGPKGLSGEVAEIRIGENEDAIRVGTTSASGEFPAPWQLAGELHREKDSRVAYDLQFSFSAGGEGMKLELKGHWQATTPRPELDPEMELAGWEAFIIGPIKKDLPGSTILDYGGQRKEMKSATLKELREEISHQ